MQCLFSLCLNSLKNAKPDDVFQQPTNPVCSLLFTVLKFFVFANKEFFYGAFITSTENDTFIVSETTLEDQPGSFYRNAVPLDFTLPMSYPELYILYSEMLN